MAIGRRKPPAGDPPPGHVGFGWDGGLILSSIPIENKPTRLYVQLRGEVVTEMLAPADVIYRLRDAEKALAGCFSVDAIQSWSQLVRFDQWPNAAASRPLESAIRSFGGRFPWLSDPYAWTRRCEDAARRHGYVMPTKPATMTAYEFLAGVKIG